MILWPAYLTDTDSIRTYCWGWSTRLDHVICVCCMYGDMWLKTIVEEPVDVSTWENHLRKILKRILRTFYLCPLDIRVLGEERSRGSDCWSPLQSAKDHTDWCRRSLPMGQSASAISCWLVLLSSSLETDHGMDDQLVSRRSRLWVYDWKWKEVHGVLLLLVGLE